MSPIPIGDIPKRPREPWLSTVLRALVHAAAATAFAYPLTVLDAVVAAAVGAAAGSVLGRVLGQTRVRTAALLASALGVLAVAVIGRELMLDGAWLPAWLGPAGALRAGDALELGVGALAVSCGLRVVSTRWPPAAIAEVAFVGLAFAELVVAHRNGAINRPFDIADPIIATGGDPTIAMIAVGVGASVVIVLLLLSERNLLRSALHLSFVGIVLLFIVSTTAMIGLPAPPETGGGLGLRGEGDEERERGEDDAEGRRNNEQLEFRDNYDSDANRVPVGVVQLHDDYSPPMGLYYFRQGAFSQYNGRRLVASTRPDVDRDIATHFPTSHSPIADPPVAGAHRATLQTTVALLADHTRPFALESPLWLEPAPNPDPRRFRRLYHATSAAVTADFVSMLGTRAGDPRWTAEQWSHYTRSPGDARYQELAEQIVGRLPEHLQHEPVAQALAISDWLGQHGVYSLRSRHAEADDPTGSFLFGDRTGYCVHFAHAAAYLMRAVGLPSRVATGYAIEESTRAGGSTVLVTGNASHAWPETYVAGIGWVIVDVSPETVISPPPPPPDPDLQRLLGELMRGQLPVPTDAPPQPVDVQARSVLGWLGGGVLGLLASAFLFLLGGKVWWRLSPWVASEAAQPVVAYRAELDRLAALGLRRRFGESREAFAARIAAQAPSFEALTRQNVGARFGARRRSDTPPAAVARAVRRELRARFPLWRRALGTATLWSWLMAR